MLNPIYKAIGYLLAVAYSIVPGHNLGLAIILLTCVVMLVLFPLTAKQARSMIAMQKVQPEIKRLQQKYKNDKQKQNEEILKFYQENKINPLAGCLPLVMQLPIFISLFHVLRGIKSQVPTHGSFDRLFRDTCGTATNAHTCTHPKGLHFLGMDLSKTLLDARAGGFVHVLPYVVAVLLIVATGWYQARQTMARQASNPQASQSPVNSQMQFMTKVFPVVFGVFSIRFASGLMVYWITSNLWRIGQQHLVLNKIYDEAHAPAAPKDGDVIDVDADDEPAASTESKPARPSRPAKRPKQPPRTTPATRAEKPAPSAAPAVPPKGKLAPKSGSGAKSVRRPGSPTPARSDRGNGNGSPNGAGNGAAAGAADPAGTARRKKRKR